MMNKTKIIAEMNERINGWMIGLDGWMVGWSERMKIYHK